MKRFGVGVLLAAALVLSVGGTAVADDGDDGVDSTEAKSKSSLGDNDNFGYGIGTGPPPCEFYDNSEPEDLGVFDRELSGGDETDQWTHTFRVRGTPTKVTLTTWEIFSDNTSSTIDLDGHTLQYAKEPFGVCGAYPESGIKRVHLLTGADAAIAADGEVVVTFSENGDDISIDRAILKIRFRRG